MTFRSKGTVAVLAGCAVVLVMLLAVVATVRRASVARETRAETILHDGWQERNARALLGLSAVGSLSASEQARFNAAKADPERMRQVLIGVHEERLADAGKDLQDAEQRKVDLQGAGGYKVYSGQPEGADLVELANQDEWAATSALAQDAAGLRAVRAWQPVNYKAYAAEVARGAVPAEEARGAAPAAPADAAPKPDPRGSLVANGRASAPVAEEVVAPVAGSRLPERRPAQEAALPSSAAPMVAPIVRVAPRAAATEPALIDVDLAARTQQEAQIREVLAQWAQAMTKNDPAAEVAAYAPHMNRYFLRTNVNRGFVLADKTDYLRRGNLTAGFALADVRIEDETASTADVRLVKDVTWQRSSSGAEHKLIRSELHLVKTEEGWRIAGERDFR